MIINILFCTSIFPPRLCQKGGHEMNSYVIRSFSNGHFKAEGVWAGALSWYNFRAHIPARLDRLCNLRTITFHYPWSWWALNEASRNKIPIAATFDQGINQWSFFTVLSYFSVSWLEKRLWSMGKWECNISPTNDISLVVRAPCCNTIL